MARQFTAILSAVLLSSVAFQSLALAKSSPPAKVAMTASENQQQAAIWVSRFLTRMHYKTTPLDDAMSQQILKRYLDTLDGEHWFFTQADIAGFQSYSTTLDDAISEQKLSAPYDMYAVYRKRVGERTAHARALLNVPFDFTVAEDYVYDREDASWAKDAAELNEIWRKRVKNDVLRLKIAGKTDAAIRETLDKRYKEFQTRIDDIDGDDVFSMFLNAYSTSVEPHTNYLSPRASENFSMQMRLSLDGIGAMLQRDGDYVTIASLVKGGPAQRQGELQEFDRVVSVAQGDKGDLVDVVGWRVDDVVDLIRGKAATIVRLEVLPGDASAAAKTRVIRIVRGKVKLEEQAAKKRVLPVVENGVTRKIGVIELPAFYIDFAARARGDAEYRSSTRDVANLIGELKREKVDAIVMDLRNNGGGSLSEAAELTGLFIDTGPVVQVRDSRGKIEVYDDPNRGIVWNGQFGVIINRASASASEIFAGAIQDYGRGIILGETSFGKGTVQNLVDLDRIAGMPANSLGELKMTVQQFFRVSGSSTQHKGVVPDLNFPATIAMDEFGESSYDNALPYTQVPAAPFKRYGSGLGATLPILKARFEARSNKDQEFRFLLEDLAQREKMRKETTVSLVLADRKTERDELEAKRIARVKTREALGDKLAADKSAELDDGLDGAERLRAIREREKRAEALDQPDTMLIQAAAIMSDIVGLTDPKLRTAIAGSVGGAAGSK